MLGTFIFSTIISEGYLVERHSLEILLKVRSSKLDQFSLYFCFYYTSHEVFKLLFKINNRINYFKNFLFWRSLNDKSIKQNIIKM